MDEIKSTLDLVMERTKDMVQSDEERRLTAEKEWENEARRYLLQLEQGELLPGELPSLFEDLETEEKRELKKGLIRAMIKSLDLEQDNRILLAGLGILAGDIIGPLIWRVEEVLKNYEQEKKKLSEQATGRLLQELVAAGISGSAVKPKFDNDPGYLEDEADLKRKFVDRLSALQTEMIEKQDQSAG